jgi:hypothetical protein
VLPVVLVQVVAGEEIMYIDAKECLKQMRILSIAHTFEQKCWFQTKQNKKKELNTVLSFNLLNTEKTRRNEH